MLISSTIQEYLTKYAQKMSCLVSTYCYLNITVHYICQFICLFEIIKVDWPQNALLNVYVSYRDAWTHLKSKDENKKDDTQDQEAKSRETRESQVLMKRTSYFDTAYYAHPFPAHPPHPTPLS